MKSFLGNVFKTDTEKMKESIPKLFQMLVK